MKTARHFQIPEENEAATAYWAGLLDARTFVSPEGQAVPYRLFVPEGYTPGKRYPFHLHLHGGGLRGTDNQMQLQGDHKQTQMLLHYQQREPFLFVIPQCPPEVFWSDATTYDKQAGEYNVSIRPDNESALIRALMGLVDAMLREFSVDTGRLYLSGCSMGGMGSYDILARYPDRFAAAFIGCAASDPSSADAVKRTPVYLCHGSMDQVISVEGSRSMAAALEAVGADYKYMEFEGRTHDFTAPATGDDELAGIMAWLHTQKK